MSSILSVSQQSHLVSSDEEPDDLFTDPPWTDKRIAEEMLRKYRFPNSNTNISVSVSVTIEKIDSQIDDLCHLQLLVKQKWMEPQLAYKNLRDSIHPIKIRNVNYIWNPQLAIEGIQESQMVGKDDVLLYSNGIVEYMYRKKIDLPAEHEMWSFPFDKRNCSLNFGNEDVRASWTYLSGAHVSEHESPWKVVESSKLGKKLSVNLRRSLSTWLWSLYIPTTILVFCSWIPLWLTSESQTSRSVLNATAFFTIFIIVLINLKEIPRTSYLKAVDIWCMIVCVFPLLALIQSTMVSSAAYKKRWQQILKTDDNEEKTRWLNETPYYAQLPAQRPKSCAKIMDYIFRVALPLTFCTAVCLYMITFIIPYSR
ncbi:hypothetical protein L596_026034 [Steinernema carpocapsae]|uniref:Uncharacterized protein n=1 Tax=Steinernema carpocapsae TaxID=34508 RepID=A0A4V5ZY21_STECR|nr:hypothetical protein L596_026034 [Steinernema carpocapsae]